MSGKLRERDVAQERQQQPQQQQQQKRLDGSKSSRRKFYATRSLADLWLAQRESQAARRWEQNLIWAPSELWHGPRKQRRPFIRAPLRLIRTRLARRKLGERPFRELTHSPALITTERLTMVPNGLEAWHL